MSEKSPKVKAAEGGYPDIQNGSIERDRHLKASDRALSRIHDVLFVRYRILTLITSFALYALIMFAYGPNLGVSSNYTIILPVIVCAVGFGFYGGFIAGFLGLPLNLIIFELLGHPEFSPESKPIAEISGIILGVALGYLSDYYRRLEAEIAHRKTIEAALRQTLKERDLLTHEVHHRVKNNLNVVRSIIQLQKNRSKSPEFIDASNKLVKRIHAISLVHERLYRNERSLEVDLEDYVPELVKFVAEGIASPGDVIETKVEMRGIAVSIDVASSVGLILVETLVNSFKHGFKGIDSPRASVSIKLDAHRIRMLVRDNGTGIVESPEKADGLGVKLVKTLGAELGGIPTWENDHGTVFTLDFPMKSKPPILTDEREIPKGIE